MASIEAATRSALRSGESDASENAPPVCAEAHVERAENEASASPCRKHRRVNKAVAGKELPLPEAYAEDTGSAEDAWIRWGVSTGKMKEDMLNQESARR